ncbi:MAG: hypothetical protein A3J67_00575 [Parcubacteria group bacterium RIFCSPHIGHO2_02_FULL_48_10b]|nr:MAG: hypothetical protein A3J67_00575 [Parcubacteria group bacterium RIFCSPHIGHO2_02_FULL_48_10b]
MTSEREKKPWKFFIFSLVAITVLVVVAKFCGSSAGRPDNATYLTYQAYQRLIEEGPVQYVSIDERCAYSEAAVILGGRPITVRVIPPSMEEHRRWLEGKRTSTVNRRPSGLSQKIACPERITLIDYVHFLEAIRHGKIFGTITALYVGGKATGIMEGSIKERDYEYRFRVSVMRSDAPVADNRHLDEVQAWNKEHPTAPVRIVQHDSPPPQRKNSGTVLFSSILLYIIIGFFAFAALFSRMKRILEKQRFAPENVRRDDRVIEALQKENGVAQEAFDEFDVTIVTEPRTVRTWLTQSRRVGRIIGGNIWLFIVRIRNYLKVRLQQWMRRRKKKR